MSFLVHITLTALLLASCDSGASLSQENNITKILNGMQGYTLFNRLLLETRVADDINSRTSLTILAPNDSIVTLMLNGYVGGSIPTQPVSDILRYHVLLEYFDLPKMKQNVAITGRKDVTTLFQTTGRAAKSMGYVSLISEPNGAVGVGLPVEKSSPNATILNTLKLFPYNISVLQISALLVPVGIPSSSPPSPPVNIIDVLNKTLEFTTFVNFLRLTKVGRIFEQSENQEGITIFAPSDDAFEALPPQYAVEQLTAQHKILLIEFHALTSFYPLGLLSGFKNPAAPTFATTDPLEGGAGQFTVNVTIVNGVVIVNTGIVSAPVIRTVREKKPVAIYVIGHVLLPEKLFGTSSSPSAPSHVPRTEAPPPPAAHPPPLSPPTPSYTPPSITPPADTSGPSPDHSSGTTSDDSSGASLQVYVSISQFISVFTVVLSRLLF